MACVATRLPLRMLLTTVVGSTFIFPLVVMGYEFWEPLRAFLRGKMFSEGTLREGEVVPHYTDDPHEAVEFIKNARVSPEGG